MGGPVPLCGKLFKLHQSKCGQSVGGLLSCSSAEARGERLFAEGTGRSKEPGSAFPSTIFRCEAKFVTRPAHHESEGEF